MLENDDLKYSILACSAAHLHQSSNTLSLPAALEFYHRAVKEVKKSVRRVHQKGVQIGDGLVMAVMCLIVYGVLSPDQVSTLFHLGAVIHMLKCRINYNAPNNLDDRPTTLLDLYVVDSTLFHIFRVAMWHANANRGFLVDTEFWSMAERLLKHANDAGAYSSLYAREPGCQSEKTLAGLETELNFYKAASENEPTNGSPFNTKLDFYSAQPSVAYAYRLCILVATIIPINPFLSKQDGTSDIFLSQEAPSIIQQAIALLCEASLEPEWYRCYLGCWPVFIFGFCVSGTEHVQVIRHDFETRLAVSSLQEYRRMLNALEIFWAHPYVPESERLLSNNAGRMIHPQTGLNTQDK
ncbi:hypothetical protein BKA60DRAFT_668352 [Fusarium oxysporum]|nr:hypothetical protein BKA60DRAFT_668352 [Fusarium oxysporum]